MARREELLEQLEETVFALMMEEVISAEGRKALEENERLKNDESFVVPETAYRKGLDTIRRHFSKNARRTTMRTMSKLIPRVAVIVLILLLLFTTAFATIPEFRAKTMNLITEVFDDRTRIEFGEIEQRESTIENNSLAGWMPDGFELVDKRETDVVIREKYKSQNGATIDVYVSLSNGLSWELDTENAAVKDVVVNGCPAIMIFKENDIQVVWSAKESKNVYYIRGEETSAEVISRVAERVNIK